jgi:hypothetical protein
MLHRSQTLARPLYWLHSGVCSIGCTAAAAAAPAGCGCGCLGGDSLMLLLLPMMPPCDPWGACPYLIRASRRGAKGTRGRHTARPALQATGADRPCSDEHTISLGGPGDGKEWPLLHGAAQPARVPSCVHGHKAGGTTTADAHCGDLAVRCQGALVWDGASKPAALIWLLHALAPLTVRPRPGVAIHPAPAQRI